jgi:hypothetical protein
MDVLSARRCALQKLSSLGILKFVTVAVEGTM